MIYDIEVTKQEIDNAMLMPGEYKRVGDKYYIPRGMLGGYDASPLGSGSNLNPEMKEGVVMPSLPVHPDFTEMFAAIKGLMEEIRMLKAEMKIRRKSDAG